MIELDEFRRVCSLLLAHPWIFAKTMPENPHWYTLRRDWIDEQFLSVVTTMRRVGYTEYYRGRPYTMFNVNDMKYWTMGAPLKSTILINRKVISAPAPYDALAGVYDDLFTDDASKAENAALFDMIPRGDSVLDIGCGTGLFLEHRRPVSYTGVDPSSKMLARLSAKFSGASTVQARFEDFYGGTYDLIVSLFGAASYIEPLALDRVPRMLNPGGSYFLMFYQPEYTPLTYLKTGVTVPHFDDGYSSWAQSITCFGSFVIASGTV